LAPWRKVFVQRLWLFGHRGTTDMQHRRALTLDGGGVGASAMSVGNSTNYHLCHVGGDLPT
jgi:hypothetical protein